MMISLRTSAHTGAPQGSIPCPFGAIHLLAISCDGGKDWQKNKPSIPTIGTKGIPSAVPPAIRRKTGAALKALTRSQLLTELPGEPYYLFRPQLMGESPALHISGSHHPALSENANQHKAAQSQLLTYPGYINTFAPIMQALFSN